MDVCGMLFLVKRAYCSHSQDGHTINKLKPFASVSELEIRLKKSIWYASVTNKSFEVF